MDTLECDEIELDAVPQGDAAIKLMGRAGAIWAKVLLLSDGKALSIACRDLCHVGQTARGVAKKAKRSGIAVTMKRGQDRLYVWRVKA